MFLISNPVLPDPNFARTIVLLCEHDDDDGSMGLVVNRPASLKLEDTMTELQAHPGQTLWLGGPVQPNAVIVLHRDTDIPGAKPIVDGISLGGDEEALLALVRGPRHQDLRVFAGYAGWSPGQLAAELETHSWIVCPATAHFVFDIPPQVAWAALLASLGRRYEYLTQLPVDPRVN